MKNIYTDIQFVKGVGPKKAKLLNKLKIQNVNQLFNYFPKDYIQLNNITNYTKPSNNQRVSFVGTVEKVNQNAGYKKLQIIVKVANFSITLIWFNAAKWLLNEIKLNQKIWVCGTVTTFMQTMQIVHPIIENLQHNTNNFWHTRKILPVYPLTAGLKIYTMRNIIYETFKEFHSCITESLPKYILKKFNFEDKHTALQRVHFPSNINKTKKAINRFKFEELFYHQILLKRCYKNNKKQKGIAFKISQNVATQIKLPFTLTNAQKNVLNQIALDMQKPFRMNRLVQGDVGSGKTIVAIFSMLIAVKNGYQTALMAPTEILAEQHYNNICKLLKGLNYNIALVKGGVSKAKRQTVLNIANNKIDIAVGTHALIQKSVSFSNLGLAVIDEQHRFGVEQRGNLAGTSNCDVLYLSATPIPRSLAMTVYGDLDLSIIDELPPNRKQIKTVWHGEQKRAKIYNDVLNQLKKGRQAYIVCPLIEESEKIDLLDAKNLHKKLTNLFKGFNCQLLHGKLKQKEKDAIMLDFKQNKTQVLVSTTVIEVGVDVANATVMVIEHAERFGLAQLHQLRGRVGRCSHQSYCILVAYPPLSQEGKTRLQTMCETNDGFKIAELDLKLRGAGDIVGKAQSGLPQFKYASIYDTELLKLASSLAQEIIEDDFNLQKPENAIVKQVYDKSYAFKESFSLI